MLRMEIALFLVMAFVAYMYFAAEKQHNLLHRIFSLLLVVMLLHLVLDGATLYTVCHLEEVPELLNDILHRLFIGTMVLLTYLYYQYIAVLIEIETEKKRKLDIPALIFLAITELGTFLLPIYYTVTPDGNYSSGPCAYMCYAGAAFYLLLCTFLLISNRKSIDRVEKTAIGIALLVELAVSILQAFNPTWLISGTGLTLMTLSFYFTLENPEVLRAELTEQKMSMLYLKSQVNPHFLYNTLDTIRIQHSLTATKRSLTY